MIQTNRMKQQDIASKFKDDMIGNRYRHFKGGIYIVTDIAVHSEGEGLMVIYKSFDEPMKTWCRPLHMFLSDVDHEKYPEVTQKKRFEKMQDLQRGKE